jgi:hypothetical protein
VATVRQVCTLYREAAERAERGERVLSTDELTGVQALATVVGVLVEVPLMLMLVRFANRTRDRFPAAPPRSVAAQA